MKIMDSKIFKEAKDKYNHARISNYDIQIGPLRFFRHFFCFPARKLHPERATREEDRRDIE